MLNPDRIIEKSTDPFPHVIIKDFFDKNFYKELEEEFPKKSNFVDSKNNVGRMHFDTSFGHALYQDILNNSNAYSKLHNYIYSDVFIKTFLDLFSDEIDYEVDKNFLKVNVKKLGIDSEPFEVGKVYNKKNFKKNKNSFLYPRLDIGMGEKGYGIKTGGSGIHVDNPQRLISILFYAGGYSEMKGGEHRLWRVADEQVKISKEIKPHSNLLVASLQNNISYHDVNPISEITGTRNAFYIAISSSNPIWKKVKVNDFNLKHNRNRCKLNFFTRVIKKLIA